MEETAPLYEIDPDWTFSFLQVTGFLLIIVLLMCASSVGVNGTGMLIPIAIFFFKLNPKLTISLSFFAAVIGSSIQTFLMWNTKHPTRKWALACNYEMMFLMLPIIFWGNLFGRKLVLVLSNSAVIVFFLVVLVFNVYQTGKRCWTAYQQETQMLNSPDQSDKNESGFQKNDQIGMQTQKCAVNLLQEQQLSQQKLTIMQEESTHLRFVYLRKTVILFVSTIMTALIVSSENYFSWASSYEVKVLAFLIFTAFTIIIASLEGRQLRERHFQKHKIGYEYDSHDFDFSDNKTLFLVVGTTCIGSLVSGIVGAGGLIMSSLFLQLNISPLVLRSTMPQLQLIYDIALSSIAMIDAQYNLKYTLISIIAASIGITIGMKGTSKLIQKTGRTSYGIFGLEICLIFSLLMLLVKLYQIEQYGAVQ